MAISSAESRFPFLTFGDAHSMEGVSNVYTAKFLCVSDSIHDFGGERYGIAIFDGHPIEGSIIHTEAQAAVGFLYE
jgi:hypothetical protein